MTKTIKVAKKDVKKFEELNRNYILIEKEPEYIEIINKRLKVNCVSCL